MHISSLCGWIKSGRLSTEWAEMLHLISFLWIWPELMKNSFSFCLHHISISLKKTNTCAKLNLIIHNTISEVNLKLSYVCVFCRRAFQEYYQEHLEYACPTEDIYLEWEMLPWQLSFATACVCSSGLPPEGAVSGDFFSLHCKMLMSLENLDHHSYSMLDIWLISLIPFSLFISMISMDWLPVSFIFFYDIKLKMLSTCLFKSSSFEMKTVYLLLLYHFSMHG